MKKHITTDNNSIDLEKMVLAPLSSVVAGDAVVASVGALVSPVGLSVGASVSPVGLSVGASVSPVGLSVGALVAVTPVVGASVGASVGLAVVGALVGASVGASVGFWVGASVGAGVDASVGFTVVGSSRKFLAETADKAITKITVVNFMFERKLGRY